MAGAEDKETLKLKDAETYAAGLKKIPGITKNYITEKKFDNGQIKDYFTTIIKLVAPWCCSPDTQGDYKTFKKDKSGLAMKSMTKMRTDLSNLRRDATGNTPLFSSLKKFVDDVATVSKNVAKSSKSFMRIHPIPSCLCVNQNIGCSLISCVFCYLIHAVPNLMKNIVTEDILCTKPKKADLNETDMDDRKSKYLAIVEKDMVKT